MPIDVVDNLDPSLARIAVVPPQALAEGEEAPAAETVDSGPSMVRLAWVAPDPDRKRGDASWRVVYAAEFEEQILLDLAGVK